MNLLNQTLILYLLVGVSIAVAVYVRSVQGPSRWLRTLMVVPFWPLFLPLLLGRPQPVGDLIQLAPRDELATAIGQVESELDGALDSLRGWADKPLAAHEDRLRQLRAHWRNQAGRIRDMDRVLEETDPMTVLPSDGIATTPLPLAVPGNDRLRLSRQARQQNLQKLRQLREESYGELLNHLAWTREIVSRILLAKYASSAPTKVTELFELLFAPPRDAETNPIDRHFAG